MFNSEAPKWALGTYKLRNGVTANVTEFRPLYIHGNIANIKLLIWDIQNGRSLENPDFDLVELIKSEKYDKYAR